MSTTRTTDRYGRPIGGSVATCPRCSGSGFVSVGMFDEEAVCGLCPVYSGLLSLPLDRETWAAIHEEEALCLGLEVYGDDAEAVKAAWLRGDLATEAA
jgi:hypothetical protein